MTQSIKSVTMHWIRIVSKTVLRINLRQDFESGIMLSTPCCFLGGEGEYIFPVYL
jgi:hypothetical protein